MAILRSRRSQVFQTLVMRHIWCPMLAVSTAILEQSREGKMPSASKDTGWGDDAVSRLRSLWEEGHSTSEMSRQLGVSKNAVIGKAHRLKLSRRPSPIQPAGSGGPRLSRRRPLLPKLAEIAPVPSATPKTGLADAASLPPTRAVSVPSAAAIQAAAPQPFLRRGTISCCWPHRRTRYAGLSLLRCASPYGQALL
jgi:GcrA cell cycle regulator